MTDTHHAFVDRKCAHCEGWGVVEFGFKCPECHGTGIIGSYEKVPDIPMNGDKEFGNLLRKTREKRKIGMDELAKLFGWSLVHLSDIETGREQPTEEEKQQIQKWLFASKSRWMI